MLWILTPENQSYVRAKEILMEAVLLNIQHFCLHDGPGIRSTIFFKGCNLRCHWCANPESISMKVRPELEESLGGRIWKLEEVLHDVLKDKVFYDESGGGVTLSGGEPLLQADFACALCDALHAHGVAVAIETAACVPEQTFMKVFEKLDVAHIDLKHWNDASYRQGTGAGIDLVLSNIRRALAGSIPVFLRIPIIPGFNDSLEDARQFGNVLADVGANAVQLLPFHQFGEKKYEKLALEYSMNGIAQLHDEDVQDYASVLKESGLHVQISG